MGIIAKPYVGQIVYQRKASDNHTKHKLKEVVVKSVGRKYFVCGDNKSEYTNIQYNISNWEEKTDYRIETKIYFSELEYLQEFEMKRICIKFSNAFENAKNRLNLSFNQLTLMEKIANGEFDSEYLSKFI